MPNLEETEAKGEIKGSGRGVELEEGGPKDRETDRGRRVSEKQGRWKGRCCQDKGQYKQTNN